MFWVATLCLFLVGTLGRIIPHIEYSPLQYTPQGYVVANFTTYVDHYTPMPNTFNMRYYTKSLYYLNGGSKGPIFFYTGNEGAVETFMNNTGFIDYLAESLNALVVYAEHRYFGESLPFGKKSYQSPSYTKYLSPHQALADYAYLITYLKTKYNNAQVVVFGGSYGGMLSAWMRIKYPDLVAGAIAASAPIMAFNGTADPNGFNAVITKDFAQAAPECPAYIATAFDYLTQVQGDLTTYYNLSMTFQTCDALITKSDVESLIGYIQTAFTYMAMTDYPYATNFLNPMPGHPVNVSCQVYNDVNMSDTWEVLQATFKAINIYYNYSGQSNCSDVFGTGTGSLGSPNGWDYLSCSTLNIPIGGIKATSMFGNQPWNQQAENQYCQQAWGVTPQINYANIFYGTNVNPMIPLRDVSNIVFSNGGLDPWQFGGVTKSNNPNIIAFVMEGAAHHLDLRYPNQMDPPEVSAGRATEQSAIEYWLGINQN